MIPKKIKSFDNNLYLKLQSDNILKRVKMFENKLYLEFGGKLFDDYHASRVLRGFEIDSKVKVLSKLKDKVEIVIVISAEDIQNYKSRSDVGVTYESDVFRLIDNLTKENIYVGSVVITKYNNQSLADSFRTKLVNLGIKVFIHYPIEGYPYDIDHILSDEGFGKNDYIETTKPIVVVTAPGPGSGKMATCLSQLYNELKHGVKAGYAKYETFPIWNLDLNHPINIAYEAATANLNDVNMIDPFHFNAYQKTAVNYNRDIEVFPVLKKIFERIYGESPYQSPTDMGVNMVGFSIIDNEKAIEASKQEIIRRYLDAKCALVNGKLSYKSTQKIQIIMNNLGISINDRKCVSAALTKEKEKLVPCAAIELVNGKIITGKRSDLLEETASCIINCLKYFAKIPDEINLISPSIIDPILQLKGEMLHKGNLRLSLDEVLIALTITAKTNPMAEIALKQLPKIAYAQMHSSILLHPDTLSTLKKLLIDVTTEPLQDSYYINK